MSEQPSLVGAAACKLFLKCSPASAADDVSLGRGSEAGLDCDRVVAVANQIPGSGPKGGIAAQLNCDRPSGIQLLCCICGYSGVDTQARHVSRCAVY